MASMQKSQMKYNTAVRLADKNSRTLVKISQLLEVTTLPNYATTDPEGHVQRTLGKRSSSVKAAVFVLNISYLSLFLKTDNLKKRLNRRLIKLARYADCPHDDRHSDFRRFVQNMQNVAAGSGSKQSVKLVYQTQASQREVFAAIQEAKAKATLTQAASSSSSLTQIRRSSLPSLPVSLPRPTSDTVIGDVKVLVDPEPSQPILPSQALPSVEAISEARSSEASLVQATAESKVGEEEGNDLSDDIEGKGREEEEEDTQGPADDGKGNEGEEEDGEEDGEDGSGEVGGVAMEDVDEQAME